MPRVSTYGVGTTLPGEAASNKQHLITLNADGAAPGLELQCEGMPMLSWWFWQAAGAAGASVSLQYAMRPEAGGGFRWLEIAPPIVLAVGTPGPPINYHLPVMRIRAVFTRPAGQPTSVQYSLGCAAGF